MRLLWSRMGFPAAAASAPIVCAAPDVLDVEPEMESAFRQSVNALRAAGFRVEVVELPDWPDLLAASRLVSQYEGSRTHELAWRQHGVRLGAKVAQLIADGLQFPESPYSQALAVIGEVKKKMDAVFREYPVLPPAIPE